MTKYCGSCKQDKETTEFARNITKKDGLQNACKLCINRFSKARYERSKDAYRERDKKLRARNQQTVYEYLLTQSCIDCRVNNPVVLTFDHVRGKKTMEVSNMVKHSWSLKHIFEEIAKCDIRCFNCHMIKDSLRRGGKKWNALNEA